MITALIKYWLLPPAINLAGLLLGLLLLGKARKTGIALILLSTVSLYLLSTALVSQALLRSVEEYPALNINYLPQVENISIVVAGAAHFDKTPEYGGNSTPSPSAITRLRYAAYLHRASGAPVLLTGGPANDLKETHSEILAQSLEQDFRVTAKWLEQRSHTTEENALYSADILLPLGRDNIFLVTHSYHMQRAVKFFTEAGFKVYPAPTALGTKPDLNVWQYWMPDDRSLSISASVLYEYLGLLRYGFLWESKQPQVLPQN